MRRFYAAGTVAVWLALVLIASDVGGAAGAGQNPTSLAPTFNQHVARILFANCVSCHHPGDIAPMSLLTFGDVRPWARAIKSKVVSHEMPPWFADPAYGDFSNKPALSQDDINTIIAW